jgi:hypothetical protein
MTLPHLIEIGLLLKTKPSGPPSKHENKDITQATHQAKQVYTNHRYYTCLFNNGGHPMGRLWMMKGHRTFEQGEIRKLQ